MDHHSKLESHRLSNHQGMSIEVLNLGGIISKILVPDKTGQTIDVALGFQNLMEYHTNPPYFGCIIGRYGNRIGSAKFTIDQQVYQLNANHGKHNLHGGPDGFHLQYWTITRIKNGLSLTRLSPHMEAGFPGNLAVTVQYILSESNELIINYQAKTDKATPVNLTNHTYFNLNGQGVASIDNHLMQIKADYITAVDKDLIPTGDYLPVANTAFDLRQTTLLKTAMAKRHDYFDVTGSFDHNWVVQEQAGKLSSVAAVHSQLTGISMEVLTTEPGMQLYCGDFDQSQFLGKHGEVYSGRAAFCLETQHHPDSPNQPHFPTTILRPEALYQSQTIYRFGLQ